MTERNELFIKHYLTDANFNGSKAYALAYKKDLINQNAICRTGASQLLQKEEIKEKINSLLEESNLTYEVALNRINFIATQVHDLQTALSAIKLYLQVTGKLNPKEVDVNIKRVYTANFG